LPNRVDIGDKPAPLIANEELEASMAIEQGAVEIEEDRVKTGEH